MRVLGRLDLAGETLRAALSAVAAAAPGWPRGGVPPDWQACHERRVKELRRPEAADEREAYAAEVGADGFMFLDALGRPGAPGGLPTLPAVVVLRRVWAHQFERVTSGAIGAKGAVLRASSYALGACGANGGFG